MGLTSSDLEKVGHMLSKEYGIKLVCVGNECKTDGNVIYLPAIPSEIDNPKLWSLIRYFLDHEVGHIVGKSDIPMLDGFKTQHGPKGAMILNALEDVRVENIMAEVWAGCGINISAGTTLLMEKLGAEGKMKRFKQFMTAIYLAGKGVEFPACIEADAGGIVQKRADEMRDVLSRAKVTSDLTDLALKLLADYEDEKPPQENQEQSPGDGEGKPEDTDSKNQSSESGEGQGGEGSGKPDSDGGEGKSEGQPEGGDSAGDGDGDSESQGQNQGEGQGGEGSSKGDSKEDGKDENAGDGQQGGGGRGGREGGDGAAESIEDQLEGCEDIGKMLASAVQEGSEEMQEQGTEDERLAMQHRPIDPSIDAVKDLQPDGNIEHRREFIKQAEVAAGPMGQRLSQLLMSEDRAWWKGGRQRGFPDPKKLAALATGTSDRVMRRRQEKPAPNTACYLLVDGSGSMADRCYGVNGDYNGPTIMHEAMVAATAFATILDRCGHKSCVAIFQDSLYQHDCTMSNLNEEARQKLKDAGYCGHGRNGFTRKAREAGRIDGVTLYRVKKWNESARKALPKMSTGSKIFDGGTPMATSVMMAGRDLAARREKRKVLMVFTDGHPHELLQTQRALRECEKAGIEVVLIGIRTDAVWSVWDKDKCAVAEKLSDLGGETMKSLTKALRPKQG